MQEVDRRKPFNAGDNTECGCAGVFCGGVWTVGLSYRMDEPFPSQLFWKSRVVESVASLWTRPHTKLPCPQRAEKVSYVLQIKNSTPLPVFLCIVRPGTSLCSNDREKGNSQ